MRRAGDWLNVFGALCALVWAIGAVHVTSDAPPLNPSRERLCADFTSQPAPSHNRIPTEIGPLAQHGAPYWATWMPTFDPIDPALVDTYPACMQDDHVFLVAQARLDQAWGTWIAARQNVIMRWAVAPLAFIPVLAVVAFVLGKMRASASTGVRQPSGTTAHPRAAAAGVSPPSMGSPRGPRRPLAPNAPSFRAQLRKDGHAGPAGSGPTGPSGGGSLQRRNR